MSMQGSPHLQKNRETWLLPQRTWGRSEGMTGRLPTASSRHVSAKMCCFFASFKKDLHLKCAFADFLLIFNFTFMFCTSCIIVVALIFVDFRFHSFHIEICKIYMYTISKCEFPPLVSIKMPPCLKLDKWIVYLWKSYK